MSRRLKSNRPRTKAQQSADVRHSAFMRDLWSDPVSRCLRKAAWTPERKAKQSALSRDLWNDPQFRAKQLAARPKRVAISHKPSDPRYDRLSKIEMANLLAALRAKQPYVDVANDWLLSIVRVRNIAREHGLSFSQPCLHRVA